MSQDKSESPRKPLGRTSRRSFLQARRRRRGHGPSARSGGAEFIPVSPAPHPGVRRVRTAHRKARKDRRVAGRAFMCWK